MVRGSKLSSKGLIHAGNMIKDAICDLESARKTIARFPELEDLTIEIEKTKCAAENKLVDIEDEIYLAHTLTEHQYLMILTNQ